MQVEHTVPVFSTKEPFNTQSRKNKNLQDIYKTSGNIRSRIMDIE